MEARKQWNDAHILQSWVENRDDQEKEVLGFLRMKDLSVRGRTCVKCHVGSPEGDVNHDLIAAGHPRLFFEFSTYMAKLPAHWDIQQERKSHAADYETKLWAIGQVLAARAAVAKLTSRAELARSKTPKPTAVWPDFAEFNCFTCHHSLAGNWYQSWGLAKTGLGQITWGAQYFPDHNLIGLNQLRREMSSLNPDPDKVVGLCEAVELELAKIESQLNHLGEPTQRLRAVLSQEPQSNWDGVAAWYMALHCFVNDCGTRPLADDSEKQLRSSMQLLRCKLAIPFGTAVNEPLLESPNVDYPALMKDIRTQLTPLLRQEISR